METTQVYIFTEGNYVKNANDFLRECWELLIQPEDVKVMACGSSMAIVITATVRLARLAMYDEIWQRYERHRRA
jgi:hypothetical protein